MAIVTETKFCPSCKEVRSQNLFGLNKHNKDGLASNCKLCRKTERARYYRFNSDKEKESVRTRAIANRDDEMERHRKYYIANQDRLKQKSALYRQENQDKIKVLNQNRRVKELKNGGKITVKEWRDLCRKYEDKCLCCGKNCKLEIDHIVPVSRGGRNTIDNVQPLCGTCNKHKATRTIDYRY